MIIIENLCAQSKPGADCKTVITKSEFERILAAIRPNLPPDARQQVAKKYVELLTFAEKAEHAGLDKSPEFREQLRLMRMQALAGAYGRHLQEKYAKAPDAEVEKYYQDNKPAYDEVTLKRIYIPKPATGGEKKPPLDEAAAKAMAEKIQARAVAGEDFDKLQAEADAAANPDASKGSAPTSTLGARRRGQLPPSHESAIFELGSGKVSPLLEEPSGYFIYKVESKQLLPLEQVKGQIARQLEEQKLRDAIQRTVSSVKATYNEKYFKVPTAPEAAPSQPSTPPK
ncbi:MAG TPA: peptidyl-prolyl cis-trans isomerase [Terriglobales bacterium]|nr:peptidyl-prolyl cis-trans isomerase [Terriglobales bacterium]